MTTHLRPMEDEELQAWMKDQREHYIEDRIGTGEQPEEAERIATEQYAMLFPEGKPAPGHFLSRVVDGDEPVGWLWIGPRTPARPDAYWVWDVVIEEAHRGRGYGRAAMLLAEEQAHGAGATEIGLNVFGYNAVARGLYESLGYETTTLQMRKELPAGS
ncbi:MAG: GNAT family N-acetyltransferase [Acidimicrobiales bacterium]|jgi:ribosomal protein S18 acetylase RimI-like enzyme